MTDPTPSKPSVGSPPWRGWSGPRRSQGSGGSYKSQSDSGPPGFFGAGDLVQGLDQISVAMGHGALAATRAHNWLREQGRHTLQQRHY